MIWTFFLDERTFEALLEKYSGQLGRVAASYEADPQLQQELLQEICLAVWQAMSRFRGDASSKTYILRIAHNRAVSHVSQQVKRSNSDSFDDQQHGLVDQVTSHEIDIYKSQQSKRLLTYVRELPLQARQVFSLAMEGLSYQDIAEVTGLTSSHVGVLLNRTKQSLKEKFSHDG